ncbi:MAG TPA: RDD family protein [Chitinophagaceae bacterium]|nr:RDD family protein [Chitinophagaceae bacterium]
MSVIKVPTNFNIELEFEIPEFYRRFFALLIDILIEYFYLRIASAIYNSVRDNSAYDESSGFNLWAFGLILFVPIMIYHLVCEITMNGQSVGKKITGLRVVDELGGKASIGQFVIRWLLRLSDVWIVMIILYLAYMVGTNQGWDSIETVFIILFGLGFLATDIVLVVSSKKGQRIGDLLAKTILIRVNTKSNIEETVFQEVADNYVPSFPQIMQLSDRDINAIKSILETARKKSDFAMAEAAGAKIKTHLKIETDMPSFDFLEVLLKDYNYLSVK